jgi:hypothetical protein
MGGVIIHYPSAVRQPDKTERKAAERQANCRVYSLSLTKQMQHSCRKQTNKLNGLSPRTNYTNRTTAACRKS